MSFNKKLLLFCSLLGALVLVLVAAVGYVLHLQSEAELLARTGRAARGLLSAYKTGVHTYFNGDDRARGLEMVAHCYDDAYAAEGGFWKERLLAELSDRDRVRVYAWELEEVGSFRKADVVEQVGRYLRGIGALEEVKFKLDSVEEIGGADAAVIRAFLWLRGSRGGGEVFESKVALRLWTRRRDGEWKIHRQELLHGHTVTGDRRGFTDITAAAGIDFEARYNPRWQTPEWELKVFGLVKYTTAGVSAVDYDGDRWDDLFFANGDRVHLYRNEGDGTFADATEAAGLPTGPIGATVGLFVDFDNDGDKDLFLGSSTDHNRLYRNEGDGTFSDVSAAANLGRNIVSVAAAADFDNDGRVDLYLGRYLDPRVDLPTTLFYTRNSQGNTLLRNVGDLRFEDVTARAGVREGGLTLGIAWGDYDDDGYQDLYVANDFGRNALLHNEGDGTFSDVSAATGTLDFGFGMSATFGDIDNDGDLDLYVSNVHSGQRWYGQAATLYKYLLTSLWQGTATEDLPLYEEILALAGSDWRSYGDWVVKGNSLLINDGQGHFTDVSEEARTNPFGWYWSSAMFDFDNDGRQDLYAVNGWISTANKDDL